MSINGSVPLIDRLNTLFGYYSGLHEPAHVKTDWPGLDLVIGSR
jgi:hypothetical protein